MFTWYQNQVHPCLVSQSMLQLGQGLKRGVRVGQSPALVGIGPVVCLNGLGQSSPYELVFGVEISPNAISLQD